VPRQRSYARPDVVEAAKAAFWDNGYQRTALSDLEQRTGLNRSSLYHAFGSKRELFAEALDAYEDDVLDALIGPLESGHQGLEAITTFLSGVKEIILDQRGEARRGCLMVNTIAELSARDEETTRRATAFRDRLRGAFANALARAAESGDVDDASVPRRSRFLTAGTLGIWLCARIDPLDAALLCEEVASEVMDWRSADRDTGSPIH
jgi:TetR/AcrR family transcriptional repressor of nem operon